jgi:atypical dual specificity phosphatase
MGKKGVPDRWENYSNIGNVVEGSKFICFKVPLNPGLLSQVRKGVDNKWGVEDVIAAMPQPGLGLVIDLTYTKS